MFRGSKGRAKFLMIARKFLPPIVLDGYRWIQSKRAVKRYLNRRVPWSPPYTGYKRAFLKKLLADEEVLDTFKAGRPLPHGYGIGVDERCIEYPWLLSHLDRDPGMVLDAGSALNYDYILDHPVLASKVIHILTLAPEKSCYWERGISYLYQDLRRTSLKSDTYDVVVCVSTLEHIGFDNRLYSANGNDREHTHDDFVHAVGELQRLLKARGSLYITVPFGVYRDFESFQQFDAELLGRVVRAFGEARAVERTFYRYGSEGWNVATAEDCATCEYVEWVARLGGSRLRSLPVEPDLAAAARAVACLKLVKA